jgi:hypothetical protein
MNWLDGTDMFGSSGVFAATRDPRLDHPRYDGKWKIYDKYDILKFTVM